MSEIYPNNLDMVMYSRSLFCRLEP